MVVLQIWLECLNTNERDFYVCLALDTQSICLNNTHSRRFILADFLSGLWLCKQSHKLVAELINIFKANLRAKPPIQKHPQQTENMGPISAYSTLL